MSTEIEAVDFAGIAATLEAKHRAWAATPEGKAQIEKATRDELAAKERDEEYAAEAQNRQLAASGVPVRVVDVLRSLEETQATRRVRGWVGERKGDDSRWCLVLSADKGCGKTVAAGLWLRETLRLMAAEVEAERSKWGAFVPTGVELPKHPTPLWLPISKFARLGAYDGEFDKVCEHAGPLVIDDLGSEYLDAKGWFLQAFDAFVDARYSQYRPTLITTNLTAAAFKGRYSERVSDRLREGGAFYEFRGQSLRGAA